jgi:probable HAF family extracellular repeat protein
MKGHKLDSPKDPSQTIIPFAWARHYLLLVLALMLGLGVQRLSAGPQFTIYDLGPGQGTFISADGQILVGPTFNHPSTTWLWQNGVITVVNTNGSTAHEVNQSGNVVGSELAGYYASPPIGDISPFYRAYLSSQGNVTRLGTLGGRASSASGINIANVVVGVADDKLQVQRPFIWQNGVMSALPLRSAISNAWTSISPMRITDDGRIYGTGKLTGAMHAIELARANDGIYDLSDLGALPGSSSSLNGFNQFGWACGEALFGSPSYVGAFLFRDRTATMLGNLGSDGSYGWGLNDLGDVVGESNSDSYRAFLWREGVMYDLNSCIDTNSGWVLVSAQAINNAGQIVGMGRMANGSYHAFLLQPLPGSDGGLRLTLGPAPNGKWQLLLTRQLGTHVGFETSADLIHWTQTSYQTNDVGYLVDADPGASAQFFRAFVTP